MNLLNFSIIVAHSTLEHMKQSLTYYVTLGVIKLKGVKKNFSKSPIDYLKIRKEDIPQIPSKLVKKYVVEHRIILKSKITEILQPNKSNQLILYIHGGAFISGPAQHHWDSIQTILIKTRKNVWMCNYPKAPEHKISEISKNIDAVYAAALESYLPKNIVLIGDSVGGTLITALVQRLIASGIQTPEKIILISPVMDASLSNPQIDVVDAIDPMLSKKGVLSAKMMCAENEDLTNTMISPINGCFQNFPKTYFYAAKNDITFPDQVLAIEKIKKLNVNLSVTYGSNMPHIWPLLPVMSEAKIALNEIIEILQ